MTHSAISQSVTDEVELMQHLIFGVFGWLNMCAIGLTESPNFYLFTLARSDSYTRAVWIWLGPLSSLATVSSRECFIP
jgi:hypothetical protein